MKTSEITPRKPAVQLPRLAYWAQSAPTKTRWIILGLHVLMGTFATFAGWILGDLGATPISKWLTIPLVLGLVAIFFYPFGKKAITWHRRKFLDATLLLAAITIWIGAGIRIHWATHEGNATISTLTMGTPAFASRVPETHPDLTPGGAPERIRPHGTPEASDYVPSSTHSLAAPEAIATPEEAVVVEDHASASTKLQNNPSTTKAKDATTKPDRKAMETGVKVLLFILAILAAFVLGYLVAVLGCYIVCSGIPVLGYAIWALGWIGLIVGLVLLARYFFRSSNTNSKHLRRGQTSPI